MLIQPSDNAKRDRIIRELATRNQKLRRPYRNGECFVIDGDNIIGRWPGLTALADHLGLLKPYERMPA